MREIEIERWRDREIDRDWVWLFELSRCYTCYGSRGVCGFV